jgi:uncharacterized protein
MMERYMRIRGFAPSTPCWAELTTASPARSAGFYAALFGWDVDGDRFLLDGRVVAGVAASRPDRPEGWLTYLASPDLDGDVRRVLAAGGQRLTDAEERSGARSLIVSDAAGAVFGLWQATGFAGAQLRGEPGAMECPDLLTDEPAPAVAFYGSVFGWSLTREFGSNEWLTPAHDSVAGLITGRFGSRWQPSFQVEDSEAFLERCAALGARVAAGPVEMGLGSYVEIVDPFGAAFAVTAPVPRPVELAVAYNDVAGLELTYDG